MSPRLEHAAKQRWLSDGKRLAKEDDVRVATAFKRLLRLPGASIVDVCFAADGSS